MNPETPPDDHLKLRAILREAHQPPELPPRFQEGVWRRLARIETKAEITTQPTWFGELVARLLRPAMASLGIASVMLLGAWLGVQNGKLEKGRAEQSRYLTSVSPFYRQAP